MKDLNDAGFVDCLNFMMELNGGDSAGTEWKDSRDAYRKTMMEKIEDLKKCFPKALGSRAFRKALGLYQTRALSNTGLQKTSAILRKEGVNQFVVTGLVFDFCVLETAVFLRSAFRGIPVSVPLPETLPALAGLVEPDEQIPGLGDHPLAHRMREEYYDWVASKYRQYDVKFTTNALPVQLLRSISSYQRTT